MILYSHSKQLDLSQPQVMGILNVTPDSFSDGGKYNSIDGAVIQAKKMIAAGATIIDIGGESTRPGAEKVSLEEELSRTIPIIKAIRIFSDVWISIDTSQAEVMKQAVAAGADIINDVRALSRPKALQTAVECNVPVCLMHMQGQPDTMQNNPDYFNVVEQVASFLNSRVDECIQAGIKPSHIILDPGFGFGKTLAHNYQLLEQLETLHQFGFPLLVGMSRKSMIFNLLEKSPTESVLGSVVCASFAVSKGAQIIRVHDVEETVEGIKIANMLNRQKIR